MYTSQQANYKALPSSTRSRRVSSNYTAAARPGLSQAAFRPNGSVVSNNSSNGSVASNATGLGSALGQQGPSSGVTLQSWARSQYQMAQTTPQQQQQQQQQFQKQQFQPRTRFDMAEPPSQHKTPTFQAHYQYSSRNASGGAAQLRPQSSSGAVQFAVADYFDPYRGSSQGQTLAVAEPPQTPKHELPRQPQQQQQQQQPTPPSPLMRAVRHSRPTTPQNSAPQLARSSNDSLRTPPKQQQQQPRFFSPQAVRTVQTAEPARFKPRSSTATEDSAAGLAKIVDADPLRPRALPLPTKPRVASMYAASNIQPNGLHVEVARTPQRASIQTTTPTAVRTQPSSGLAHAAIRDMAEMRTPATASGHRLQERNERSELIDFIERRRAQTATTDAPASFVMPAPSVSDVESHSSSTQTLLKPERSDSVSSKQSDSSERSFKRSTARLMDIDTPAPNPIAAKHKHTSWYGVPTHKPDILPAKPDPLKAAVPGIATTASNASSSKHSAMSAGLLPLQSSRIVPRGRAHTLVSPTSPAETPLPAQPQLNAYARPPRHRTPSPNPYSRSPAAMSVGVQTIDVRPAKRPTVSRAVQTSSQTIHGDEAVLDLMRQMDALRTGHANQISEYQEHVIDLELLSQDLQTDVDQLSARLEAKEANHQRIVNDLRAKLEDTRMRVDREIGDVKQMHAAKCNELGDQVAMLLERCEKYRARLVQLGTTESELLVLATGSAPKPKVEINPAQPIEQLSIVDGAFIESQYVETRESTQEADYFRQLMDIERSMENTTIALGFELKRTQAKYLQQAADFVREQMVRLQQTDARAESRLARSKSRASGHQSMGSSPVANSGNNSEPPTLPAVQPLSPVLSLTASLAQLGRPPVPPAPVTAASTSDNVRSQPHRRVAGPLDDPRPQPPTETLAEPIDPPFMSLPRQRAHSTATFSSSSSSATLPTYSARILDMVGLGIDRPPRGFDSEGRQSGLSRMVDTNTRMRSSTLTSVLLGSDDGSESDSACSPRRPHRSPLPNINGFFASSHESMNTLTGSAEALDGQQQMLSGSTLFTPPRPVTKPHSTIGYSPAPRASRHDLRPLTPTKASTVHWPQQQQRRSVVLDSVEMTAEELLQSLKLPANLGTSRISGSLTSSPALTPNGSIGRQSPVPRTASFTDLAYSPRKRGSVAGSSASDLTLAADQPVRFDPKTEITLNLGLDKPASSVSGSSRRHRRGHVQRRRSRSVGTWDRSSSAIFAAANQQ
ncbi:hypothetical protein GGF40_002020 [Coemansia sp. RSA 1286]|nr:hypothetical protein IWW45_002897 [Coemansia sp. RSA 485]KAJ2600557.1 hypothetical protein GGF39_001709 [Coemansia sp. RSA 1721]KAJ2637922.1 hypothetical protein GGF40_002020 [Coemansia sp. RSA 1286]